MLASYRSVGISLPHSSRAQAGLGRAVSRSELKPGDLIFWYHPIHHVGMYIGNGKIVHARNTRSDLVIQTLASYPAPWAGARRIVG
jgi:cell wall-associated NlpC family hydrolase